MSLDAPKSPEEKLQDVLTEVKGMQVGEADLKVNDVKFSGTNSTGVLLFYLELGKPSDPGSKELPLRCFYHSFTGEMNYYDQSYPERLKKNLDALMAKMRELMK